jgi:hypothetical protein
MKQAARSRLFWPPAQCDAEASEQSTQRGQLARGGRLDVSPSPLPNGHPFSGNGASAMPRLPTPQHPSWSTPESSLCTCRRRLAPPWENPALDQTPGDRVAPW